jgi:type II secretory pathway component PulK
VVLWITIILSGIVLTGSYLARLELRQAYYPLKEIQLVSAAKSGLETAKAVLYNDTNMVDSLNSPWQKFIHLDNLPGAVSVEVKIEDEESKVNLNTFPKAIIGQIPAFLAAANRNEMVDSLIDWIDADGTPMPNGAEEDYYSHLTPARHCKNNPVDLFDEVHLIKGFNDEQFINLLKTEACVCSNGKINLNTASKEVLTALFKGNEEIAKKVILKRNGPNGISGDQDDMPFSKESDIRSVVGNDVYSNISGYVDVKSYNFKVLIIARSGKYSKTVEAMLSREGRNISVRYWREL